MFLKVFQNSVFVLSQYLKEFFGQGTDGSIKSELIFFRA
jgi:hypothetical protein